MGVASAGVGAAPNSLCFVSGTVTGACKVGHWRSYSATQEKPVMRCCLVEILAGVCLCVHTCVYSGVQALGLLLHCSAVKGVRDGVLYKISLSNQRH